MQRPAFDRVKLNFGLAVRPVFRPGYLELKSDRGETVMTIPLALTCGNTNLDAHVASDLDIEGLCQIADDLESCATSLRETAKHCAKEMKSAA